MLRNLPPQTRRGSGGAFASTTASQIRILAYGRMEQELPGLRMLLVEDESPIASDVASTLLELGCVVLGPVTTVEGALDLSRTGQPDMVITNVTLRGCMTHPLLQTLSERGMPYVVVTGGSGDAAFSHTEGALILHKLTDESALIQAIGSVLDERGKAH